ncbi:hypothetical protein ASE17_16145 [Phenylobacterium sp. Root77]|uniref:DUF1254 domain-containing protein n=1 Tax=unclassified Phenylobacterium TaxID=2640670 RepID=UPI0006F31D2D|nr:MULTISPECIES: DUF1254 domain-containing protein [unclassified Phenylobacterium]KQW70424.1 hypothetical protein ASC73_10025 [Phenylobacterium sp. Root1277]KQW91155.1 hypothetical protein ASC79_17565 [Phenylobacterium sp. Root1290]KRC39209.1 hypothetical protein ASE17_16145 [Phenylobacterium sp. Root77]
MYPQDPAVMTGPLDTRIGKIELEVGYPSAASVTRLYDELDFQRACQAYIWAMPAVAMAALRQANKRDWDVDINTVSIIDNYTTPAVKVLTGNDTTIYAGILIDMGRDGPVVIDSPVGVYGVIDDDWQRPIVEVGPFGPDKGRGAKFLLLPPGRDERPEGYLAVPSKTNRAMYVGRAFVKDGDVDAAVATLAGIKVYPLADAKAPPPTRVERAGAKPMDSIAPRGFGYWDLLATVFESETIEPRDRFFHAMLKPLGLEKGKPFAPDARQKKILTDAAEVGFLMAQTLSMAPRLSNARSYPGTQWEWVLTLNPDQEAETYSQIDERTDYTFEAFSVAAGMIKPIVGAGSQYMSVGKDGDGNWLDGGKSYRLRVPPKAPVKEFWSLIVYDNLTRSMIETDTLRAGVSSQRGVRENADGSVDIHFGPSAPSGGSANWIKTLPGRGWFAYFRWYGPTEAFFDKSWALGDIERVG